MRTAKRSIALALSLLLIFAVLPFTEAKTGTLVKNSGTRHELCTALSSQAAAYYTGSYTYDAVSTLAASASDPMGSAMFSRLNTLMKSTMTNSVSYNGSNGLQIYWPYTDANNESTNPILFYSDATSNSFNREHVWPKSRASFHQSNGGSDLHHLRPTNANVNSTRSNYTFGNVKGVLNSYQTYAYEGKTVLWYNTNGEGRVEVNDNIKGDVARILLYVWCRWEEPNLYENDPDPYSAPGDTGGNDGRRVIESLDTLLQWMKDDPVDTWEMSRNDQCENVQGNRNVFIDYPEYAWLIFGLTPPSDYQTPSGKAMNAEPSPTVTVQPSATATATVKPTATATAMPTVKPTATATATPTATPTPKPTATPVPTVPPAVVLPTDGDYVLRIDGGYVSEHTETVNGNDCLKVELFLDGVTEEWMLSSISFKLLYDPDQLTYVKYKAVSVSNGMPAANGKVPGWFQYAFACPTGALVSESTPVLTIWFTVSDDLPAGTRIGFACSEAIKANSINSAGTSGKRTVGAVLHPFFTSPLYGDANCDGRVTSADAAAVLRHLVAFDTLTSVGRVHANVNGDGVNAQSAATILRRVVRLIDRFPIEQ